MITRTAGFLPASVKASVSRVIIASDKALRREGSSSVRHRMPSASRSERSMSFPSEAELRGLADVDFNAVGQGVGDEAIAVSAVLHLGQFVRVDGKAGVEAHHRVQIDPGDGH